MTRHLQPPRGALIPPPEEAAATAIAAALDYAEEATAELTLSRPGPHRSVHLARAIEALATALDLAEGAFATVRMRAEAGEAGDV